jgi:transposase
MSCRQLAARYNIANPHSIETWRRQHARGELQPKVNASLERSDSMATKTKAPPRSSGTGRPTEEDRLLEENHRLRAEVAYLKKVEALVLAKKLAHQKERK